MAYKYSISLPVEKERSGSGSHLENEYSAFDFPAIIKDLKGKQNWKNGELGSVILLRKPRLKVLLTVLHEGTEIVSNLVNDSATIKVLEGRLIIHVRNESLLLNEGEHVVIDEKLKFSLDSIEETAFLLTLMSDEDAG